MSPGEGEVPQLPVRAVVLLWVLAVPMVQYRYRSLVGLVTESQSACWGQRPGYRESMASGR